MRRNEAAGVLFVLMPLTQYNIIFEKNQVLKCKYLMIFCSKIIKLCK